MDLSLTAIFQRHSEKKLRDMMALIDRCCADLNESQIWQRARPEANSIGNLLMHLEGNVGQFIGHCLEGKPDVRERPLEFSTTSGIEKAALLAALHERVEQACASFALVSEDALLTPVKTINGEMTGLEVVYTVVGHFQQHTGQMLHMVKAMATA